MRNISGFEDEMRGIAKYELTNGQWIQLDAREVREYGLRAVMRRMGYEHLIGSERVKVIQDGAVIGSFPPDFDPMAIRSTSYFYRPRTGDFTRRHDAWVVCGSLGPADLEAIPGFVWDREDAHYARDERNGVTTHGDDDNNHGDSDE